MSTRPSRPSSAPSPNSQTCCRPPHRSHQRRGRRTRRCSPVVLFAPLPPPSFPRPSPLLLSLLRPLSALPHRLSPRSSRPNRPYPLPLPHLLSRSRRRRRSRIPRTCRSRRRCRSSPPRLILSPSLTRHQLLLMRPRQLPSLTRLRCLPLLLLHPFCSNLLPFTPLIVAAPPSTQLPSSTTHQFLPCSQPNPHSHCSLVRCAAGPAHFSNHPNRHTPCFPLESLSSFCRSPFPFLFCSAS